MSRGSPPRVPWGPSPEELIMSNHNSERTPGYTLWLVILVQEQTGNRVEGMKAFVINRMQN